MRTISREIIKKETKTIYEANDGTLFTCKEQCEAYENTEECVINSAFESVLSCSVSGESIQDAMNYPCADDDYVVVEVKDVNVFKVVNMKIGFSGGLKKVPVSCIGKSVIVYKGYDGETSFCGEVNEFIDRINNNLRKLFCNKKEEN